MASKLFLTDDDASNTKCSVCRNYLSMPPVIIHKNNIVCGRCVQENKLLQNNRAHFYENIAKYLFFPCKHDVHGCSVKIPWGKALDHETNCVFKKIDCPEVNCDCKILSDRIVPHFEIEHNHLILKQNQYRFPQSADNVSINTLFLWKTQVFIIQTRTEDGDIFFRICNMKEDNRNILIQLNGELSSGSICLNQFKVMEYNSKFPVFSDTERINIKTLKTILGSRIECTITFDDQGKSLNRDTNDEKLFSEMECPICLSYMKPPIFMCSAGHSLCGQCKAKLTRCPSCKSFFSNTRNYALEKIAEIISYPCKYKKQGCNFVANINNIMAHEATCSIAHESEVKCFASQGCPWKGGYATAFQHISSTHPNLCLQLGRLVSINNPYNTYDSSRTYFFLYDRKVFMLNVVWSSVAYNVETTIYWTIVCISNDRTIKEYIPYLEIVKDKRILIINGNCERVDPTNVFVYNNNPTANRYRGEVNHKNLITFPKSLLDDFMQQTNITFKLHITNHD